MSKKKKCGYVLSAHGQLGIIYPTNPNEVSWLPTGVDPNVLEAGAQALRERNDITYSAKAKLTSEEMKVLGIK